MTKLKFNGVVTEVYTTPEKEKVNSIETGANKTEFATTSEATTATDNTKAMTPLRTKEAILALSPPPDLSGYATIMALDEKVDKVTGMGLSKNDYDNTAKAKVDAIPANPKYTDTVYTHPANHPASMITQDANNRFVSDTEKSTWAGKQNALTQGANITISGNTISAVDTVYTHPVNHPASIIAQTSTARFVSDAEKSTWNSKASTDVATASDNGLMSSAMVAKLNAMPADNVKRSLVMTQTSYNALSTAEKERTDTLYFISG